MNETLTFCPNCMSPVFFITPVDEVKAVCCNCGLRLYGAKRVLKWENTMARYLSRGIAPK